MGWLKWVTSKTVLGAITAGTAHVVANPKDPMAWVTSAGVVLGAFGARDAIAKNGEGK